MSAIRVLMVAAEAYPLAKTGGLGDAVTGMSMAMGAAGLDVQLLIPAYQGVIQKLSRARVVAHLPELPGGPATLLRGRCKTSGLTVLALRNDSLYSRHTGLYVGEDGKEHADNALRFAALAHAASRIAQGLPDLERPQVVHAHDWHAALAPLLMKAAGIKDVASVLTIHNLAFQGLYDMQWADKIALPQAYRGEDHAQAWGRINFMKAGIIHADRVTTVSHHYAREILTPEFGCGLDPVLAARGPALMAIANGIDSHEWDPSHDPALGAWRYSARDVRPKAHCKAALQKEFGLPVLPDSPILAMGSRLTHQKMADVAVEALPLALQADPDLQVIAIGRGDAAMEQSLAALAERFPGRCAVRIGFDETTAHRLHAGADMLLHGSRFEPFGLTPVYAMRYGTVPVGSRVGGMVDTIRDAGDQAPDEAMRSATGVLFDGDKATAMAGAIARALRLYRQKPLWRAMQRNGMTADFGWQQAVLPYADLFANLAAALPQPQPAPVEFAVQPALTRPAAARPAPARQPATAGGMLPAAA